MVKLFKNVLKPSYKKNNYYISYGGLDEASWAESISALYIIFLGLYIKSYYYKLSFIINGLSSFLAHSPTIKKYKCFQKDIHSLDNITIWWPLWAKTFLDNFEIYDSNSTIILLSVCTTNYLTNNNFEKAIGSKTSMIMSIIILSIHTFDNWQLDFIILFIFAFLAKILEKYILLEIYNEKIRFHTLWHIIGAHMFKKITEM